MLATMEAMTRPPPVPQTAAQRAARADGMAYLAPTFALVDGPKDDSQSNIAAFSSNGV